MLSLVRNIRRCLGKQLYCASNINNYINTSNINKNINISINNNIINRYKHFYTRTHEYINFVEKDIVRIGITNYAKKNLGDLVFIELSDVDIELEKDEELATLESVKATSGMYAPSEGTVISHNEEFVNDTDKYNKTKDEIDTWLVEYKLGNEIDKDLLLSKDEYHTFVDKEK